jgi:hypothetical protein
MIAAPTSVQPEPMAGLSFIVTVFDKTRFLPGVAAARGSEHCVGRRSWAYRLWTVLMLEVRLAAERSG